MTQHLYLFADFKIGVSLHPVGDMLASEVFRARILNGSIGAAVIHMFDSQRLNHLGANFTGL
jgi:hypothetical protein